ncbi:unnamed protein product [Symbiodinium natans]|uniref:Uncharacterized protein n=1 Tax=Symbiodinium natans TaxID=878477 RepID=A0A812RJ99_9DINO|nr:unnamed protein product [Symbiodinium natans]
MLTLLTTLCHGAGQKPKDHSSAEVVVPVPMSDPVPATGLHAIETSPEQGVAVRFTVRTDVTVGRRLPEKAQDSGDTGDCGDSGFGAPSGSLRSEWMKVLRKEEDGNDGKARLDKRPHKSRELREGGKEGSSGLPTCGIEACGPVHFFSYGPEGVAAPHRLNVVQSDFTQHNMLAAAVRMAFYEHYPLRLSPDVIWLTIVQGLAAHVRQDPETHRKSFEIQFEGKQQLAVLRPDFVKGSARNDWTTVFPEFTEQIGSFIGEKFLATMRSDFSTTDSVTKICSEIAIMDSVQSYFEYVMCCGCGIPWIELAGTEEDWLSVRGKAEVLLKRFAGLEAWLDELLPLLDQFCSATKGQPDLVFWNSVCNMYGASGSWNGFATGWLQILFPYLEGGRPNRSIGAWRTNYEQGLAAKGHGLDDMGKLNANTDEAKSWRGGFRGPSPTAGCAVKWTHFPTSLSQAPVLYKDFQTKKNFRMSFNSGIVAVVQHPTLALEPVCSWAVLDHGQVAA